MKKFRQYLVIGMGMFGEAVASTLTELGHEVLALDENPERLSAVQDVVTHTVCADATDVRVLKSIGANNFDAAVIAIGNNMQASTLATLLCKEVGVPRVIAKAQSVLHKRVLMKIGADEVIFPEESSGMKLAHALDNPGVMELAEIAPKIKLAEVPALPEWDGKTLAGLNLRQKYNVNVLLIQREGKVLPVPAGDFVLRLGDNVILCGALEDVRKLMK